MVVTLVGGSVGSSQFDIRVLVQTNHAWFGDSPDEFNARNWKIEYFPTDPHVDPLTTCTNVEYVAKDTVTCIIAAHTVALEGEIKFVVSVDGVQMVAWSNILYTEKPSIWSTSVGVYSVSPSTIPPCTSTVLTIHGGPFVDGEITFVSYFAGGPLTQRMPECSSWEYIDSGTITCTLDEDVVEPCPHGEKCKAYIVVGIQGKKGRTTAVSASWIESKSTHHDRVHVHNGHIVCHKFQFNLN